MDVSLKFRVIRYFSRSPRYNPVPFLKKNILTYTEIYFKINKSPLPNRERTS